MFLVVYHMVVENVAYAQGEWLSLGAPEWYLICHVTGGILYEVGQMFGGFASYLQVKCPCQPGSCTH
jgi:hypothetical protein